MLRCYNFFFHSFLCPVSVVGANRHAIEIDIRGAVSARPCEWTEQTHTWESGKQEKKSKANVKNVLFYRDLAVIVCACVFGCFSEAVWLSVIATTTAQLTIIDNKLRALCMCCLCIVGGVVGRQTDWTEFRRQAKRVVSAHDDRSKGSQHTTAALDWLCM